MSFKIKFLKANEGDSLIIKFGSNRKIYNILVDGGTGRVYNEVLRNELEIVRNAEQCLDLLIVTHIDDDHIGGILEMFYNLKGNAVDKEKRSLIKEVWFNSELIIKERIKELDIDAKAMFFKEGLLGKKKSVKQGVSFEEYLRRLDCWKKQLIEYSNEFNEKPIGDGKITVLSPRWKGIEGLNRKWEREKGSIKKAGYRADYKHSIESLIKRRFKEDKSVTNKSSISFILQYENKKILMLGDAHPTDIIESLNEMGFNGENPLNLEYVKISHHGSKSNTSDELLKILNCKKFIISSNGGSHCLPNKECLSRIINIFGQKLKSIKWKKFIANSDKIRHIFINRNYLANIINGKNLNFYFNYPIWDSIFTEDEIKIYRINCVYKEELEV